MIYKQDAAKHIGDFGCYFLCLLYYAEQITGKYLDAIEAYSDCIKAGSLTVNCYVNDAAKIMHYLTGKKVEVFHAGIDYECKDNEYEITRFERELPGSVLSHFVCTRYVFPCPYNGNSFTVGESVIYDPMGGSLTVAVGKPQSKRIIRILG